jgi:hypothetical protein
MAPTRRDNGCAILFHQLGGKSLARFRVLFLALAGSRAIKREGGRNDSADGLCRHLGDTTFASCLARTDIHAAARRRARFSSSKTVISSLSVCRNTCVVYHINFIWSWMGAWRGGREQSAGLLLLVLVTSQPAAAVVEG